MSHHPITCHMQPVERWLWAPTSPGPCASWLRLPNRGFSDKAGVLEDEASVGDGGGWRGLGCMPGKHGDQEAVRFPVRGNLLNHPSFICAMGTPSVGRAGTCILPMAQPSNEIYTIVMLIYFSWRACLPMQETGDSRFDPRAGEDPLDWEVATHFLLLYG